MVYVLHSSIDRSIIDPEQLPYSYLSLLSLSRDDSTRVSLLGIVPYEEDDLHLLHHSQQKFESQLWGLAIKCFKCAKLHGDTLSCVPKRRRSVDINILLREASLGIILNSFCLEDLHGRNISSFRWFPGR